MSKDITSLSPEKALALNNLAKKSDDELKVIFSTYQTDIETLLHGVNETEFVAFVTNYKRIRDQLLIALKTILKGLKQHHSPQRSLITKISNCIDALEGKKHWLGGDTSLINPFAELKEIIENDDWKIVMRDIKNDLALEAMVGKYQFEFEISHEVGDGELTVLGKENRYQVELKINNVSINSAHNFSGNGEASVLFLEDKDEYEISSNHFSLKKIDEEIIIEQILIEIRMDHSKNVNDLGIIWIKHDESWLNGKITLTKISPS